jgi:hypothetical protein
LIERVFGTTLLSSATGNCDTPRSYGAHHSTGTPDLASGSGQQDLHTPRLPQRHHHQHGEQR